MSVLKSSKLVQTLPDGVASRRRGAMDGIKK